MRLKYCLNMQIKMNLQLNDAIRSLNGNYLNKCEEFNTIAIKRVNSGDQNDRNIFQTENMLDDMNVDSVCETNGDTDSDEMNSREKIIRSPAENKNTENDNKSGLNIKTDGVKISFSVDRLLNDSTPHCDSKALIQANEMQQTNLNKRFPSEVLTVDKLLSSPVSGSSQIDKFNKTIVRPMPVRYLSSTVPLINSSYPSNLIPTSDTAVIAPIRMPTIYKFSNISFNNSHFAKEKSLDFQERHHYFYSRPQLTNQQSNQHAYSIDEQTSINLLTNSSSGSHLTSNSSSVAHSTPATATSTHSKRKRSWSRAVFSQLQRKGLEIQFQIQKYITKPDRRKLAARLGLTDAQVKVWFQNRRMKWRHTRENKINQNKSSSKNSASATDKCNGNSKENAVNDDDDELDIGDSSSTSSGADEIDVEAE